MMAVVDPYQEWLGIPPEQQPPNHYRLLGLPLFTDDPYVIAHAAHQRFTDIRAKQTGEHALLSQRIFDEIVAAEACLLNPETKAAYDAELRSQYLVAQRPSQLYVSPYSVPDQQTYETPPTSPPPPPVSPPVPSATSQSVAPPVPLATSQIETPANGDHVEEGGPSRSKVAIRFSGLLVVAGIGLLLGYKSLPAVVQVIMYKLLPPFALAAIVVSLLIYIRLLLPAGRKWVAQRGERTAIPSDRGEGTAFEAKPWSNRVDAVADQSGIEKPMTPLSEFTRLVRLVIAHRHVVQEPPVAFAVLSAVIVLVYVALLLVTGFQTSKWEGWAQ